MEMIYDDKDPDRPSDSFRLVLLNSGWHVVAKGYLCRVSDDKEGRHLIDSIRSSLNLPRLHADKD